MATVPQRVTPRFLSASLANPYTNPTDVYNAIYRARFQGPLTDPYNVGAALRATGASYGQLANNVRSAAVAEGASNAETARQEAGYYPAQAGYQTGLAQLQARQNQDKLSTIQDIEQAWQATKEAGLDPNSDEGHQYMIAHMNTRGGAASITPQITADYQRQQTQSTQKQYAKYYIDQQIRNAAMKKFIQENKADMLNRYDEHNMSEQQAQEYLIAGAKQAGDDAVQRLDVQPDIDPYTGEITLYDKEGNQQPLNPLVKAGIQRMAMQGADPWTAGKALQDEAMKEMTNVYQTAKPYYNPQQRAQAAQAKQPPPYNPKNDPSHIIFEGRLKREQDRLKLYESHPDQYSAQQIKDQEQKVMDAERALMGYHNGRQGAVPPSPDMFQQGIAGGGANVGATADGRDYGMDYGATYPAASPSGAQNYGLPEGYGEPGYAPAPSPASPSASLPAQPGSSFWSRIPQRGLPPLSIDMSAPTPGQQTDRGLWALMNMLRQQPNQNLPSPYGETGAE